MTYARAFFELQWRFAATVARLSSLSLEKALLDYTNLYIRFGLGRAFDPAHPVWCDYLAGLRGAADAGGWTWRFAQSRPAEVEVPGLVARAGCFAYARLGDGNLRLHFHNAEPSGCSPLDRARLPARLDELRNLFAHAKAAEPATARVLGVSWLYNLPAYRRCFPASYLATARPAGPRFRNMPLWGQFLNRHGEVRPAVATVFLERLAGQVSLDDIVDCFPLRPLAVEAPVTAFYAFLELTGAD